MKNHRPATCPYSEMVWYNLGFFFQAVSSTLKMGKDSAPETTEKFHALTRLSAR